MSLLRGRSPCFVIADAVRASLPSGGRAPHDRPTPTGGTALRGRSRRPPPMARARRCWTGVEVPGTKAAAAARRHRRRPGRRARQVKQAIWAANALAGKPYRYGGGHNRSSTSTRATTARAPSPSRSTPPACSSRRSTPARFMRWGRAARARWITVFTNPGHAYVVIAGLRLDTSVAGMSRTRGGRRVGLRERPALAPDAALAARLRQAPPRLRSNRADPVRAVAAGAG